MAKQTFTTGQVLSAAQMTSLQQTAMGGGAASTKTASYVLVAADAGTVVQMNAAGATTITVNTSLFSAGDTVFIQNIGAGVCTVTAGTATVNTHGSLALSQWEGGQLYFNSASAAVFFDISQSTGMTNPMTTTGDTIYSSDGSGTPTRRAIGTTGQVLTVAGGIPTWATAAAGGKILQVVQATTSTSTTINTTVYTDTTITATITPTLATSKVLILVDMQFYCDIASSQKNISTQLLRNSSVIFGDGSSGAVSSQLTAVGATVIALANRIPINYLDSPATTASTTYKVQAQTAHTSGNFKAQSDSAPSSIILLEVGV